MSTEPSPNICPACGHWFKTQQGMHSHLRQSCRCSWYRKGKNPEESHRLEKESPVAADDEGGEVLLEDDDEELPGDVVEDFYEENVFQFINIPAPVEIGEAGPSTLPASCHRTTSRLLNDDDDDERVTDVHSTAGRVIRMDDTLHQKWEKFFGKDKDGDGDVDMEGGEREEVDYTPFASEMDWRIARWVVKENPGHKAFDRLLAIPGVSILLLLLQHFIDESSRCRRN